MTSPARGQHDELVIHQAEINRNKTRIRLRSILKGTCVIFVYWALKQP